MTRGVLLGSIGFSLVLFAACGASETDLETIPDRPEPKGGSSSKGGAGGKSGAAGKAGSSAAGKGGAAGNAGTGGTAGGKAGSAGATAAGSAGATNGGSGGAAAGNAGAAGSAPACSAGRGDCNESAADGCETDLMSSKDHCGACDAACPTASSATVTCQAGKCVNNCFLGTGDCDNDPKNGCETNTSEDPKNCGTCGAPACPDGPNGLASCEGGSCAFACQDGFGNCNDQPGCETTLATDVANCGACGINCGASATCKGGKCECAASTSVAELIPLDLHLLLDKSGSMTESVKCTAIFFCSSKTKWSETTKAIKSFLGGVTAADRIGMGLTLFPQGNANQACPISLYEKALVESADLPGAAGALTSGINNTQPDGENTPTRAALEGAINHAVAFQAANPGRKSVVLLATDGQPTGCFPNAVADVGNIAAAGKAKGIPTYVIGVFSEDALFGGDGAEGPLNEWAQKGGTNKAFFPAVGDNLADEFKKTLDQIRKTAIGCEYLVPKPQGGQAFDANKVNVGYSPGGTGAEQPFVNVPDAAACKAGAWYYDNPAAPTKILLCPEVCTTVKADPTAKVNVSVGCGTRKD